MPRVIRVESPSRPCLTHEALHRQLNAYNHSRFAPALPEARWEQSLRDDAAWLRLEGEFVEQERHAVTGRAQAAPRDVRAFVDWFEELRVSGPGQHDPLFDWLASDAPHDALRWFLQQEIAGEAGFDDLIALTQQKMPVRAKLELARNYWDEMGRGRADGMHGPMLAALARELDLPSDPLAVVWESLALGNLMVALAANRRYAYQSIGALGVIELTAPDRAAAVNAALKRVGVRGEARRYFALHATLDLKHSAAWTKEVLYPLIEAQSEVATAIAEGALMRLEAGKRCFDRYRHELHQRMLLGRTGS